MITQTQRKDRRNGEPKNEWENKSQLTRQDT